MNYNWISLYNDLGSLSTLTEQKKQKFDLKSNARLIIVKQITVSDVLEKSVTCFNACSRKTKFSEHSGTNL